MSSVKLLSDFNQLLLIRLDDEESAFHSLVGCAFAVRRNGDHASTWPEETPRPLERVTADGIEDDIHVPNLFFKPGGFVVNHLVRSQSLNEIDVLS